jgi:hypothetical protein
MLIKIVNINMYGGVERFGALYAIKQMSLRVSPLGAA